MAFAAVPDTAEPMALTADESEDDTPARLVETPATDEDTAPSDDDTAATLDAAAPPRLPRAVAALATSERLFALARAPRVETVTGDQLAVEPLVVRKLPALPGWPGRLPELDSKARPLA